ncbi:hypothetical protein Scep_006230 [Stephania cephalantha]|uniref:Short-chain dehydrogenase TIC 32, chloroplastic-like n=1 Tax=Stephania cephalantha TaxID=152367 RepID=A0AAP0PJW4_9MAGN
MRFFGKKSPLGFSSSSTAEEVTQGVDGTGLTAIVTGAASGIGAETARVLALSGVHVVIGDLNFAAAMNVKAAIVKKLPDAKVDVLELDLSSMASIREFVREFHSLNLPLNILINNAGILSLQFMLSKDNLEQHFAINYLGHFLLIDLLLEKMETTALHSKIEGRIVNVSSIGHYMTYREGIRFDKINEEPSYSGFRAYGQSKLAVILHSNELARRLEERGVQITSNSLCPGFVSNTNIFKLPTLLWGLHIFKFLIKNVQQGAATTCYAALHPQVKGVSGQFFRNCDIAETSSQAQDEELAKKLWDYSTSLIH